MQTVIIFILMFTDICFAIALLHVLRRDVHKRTELEAKKREVARKFYETQVLQEISEKIGYTLNVQTVAETIVHSLENLFQVTTVSYALVENHNISVNTLAREVVDQKYLEQISQIVLNALFNADESIKGYKTDITTTMAQNAKNYSGLHFTPSPQVYFNVPLVANERIIGMITVSSRVNKGFTEEDMDIVYQVVKQAEKATQQLDTLIRSENDRLINLVSSLPTPAILFTKQADKVSVSAANAIATRLLGLPADPNFDDVIWSMDGQIDLKRLLSDVYTKSVSIFLRQAILKNRDYKVYINPVYSPQGSEVTGVTLTLLDVTSEVESEKMREKFTNMVVHELRAPMTSIKGGAGLMLKGTLSPEDQGKMLHIIADSSDRMLGQINDLLDAAKLEAGKFAIAPALADINELVKIRVEAFSYLASTKQITLDTQLDSLMQKFPFDKMRIDQVITNLLSNSLKFTPANGHIVVSTKQENGIATVAVTDDGMGIPQGKENLLFVPFSQMQSAFRRDGTGLGLYISRGIVESHGGKINMKPNEGKGATVSFTLPLDQKILAPDSVPAVQQIVPVKETAQTSALLSQMAASKKVVN
jgi:signal transduction histidine kinase